MNPLRFGAGYWIGAICSTLIGLALPFIDGAISISLPQSSLNPLYKLGNSLYQVFVTAMITGFVFSLKSLRKGQCSSERNAVLGGALGVLLCGWPVLWLCIEIVIAMKTAWQ